MKFSLTQLFRETKIEIKTCLFRSWRLHYHLLDSDHEDNITTSWSQTKSNDKFELYLSFVFITENPITSLLLTNLSKFEKFLKLLRWTSYQASKKQPPEKFYEKKYSWKFRKIYSKTPVPEPATLLKKRLWYRCFPVNFVKFLRTSFLQNTSGRLLLASIIWT